MHDDSFTRAASPRFLRQRQAFGATPGSGPQQPAAGPDTAPLAARTDRAGEGAQRRIAATAVLVVGAGGLGSATLPYLAAAGFGRIGLCDFDVVEETNLARQTLYTPADVGQPKLAAAAARVRAWAEGATVTTHPRLDPSGAQEVVANYDLVLDCTDGFASKFLVADAAARSQKPLVWGSVVGWRYQVTVCPPPLSLRDLYPQPPAAGTTPQSADVGVIGAVVGQTGTIMATEANRIAAGLQSPLSGVVLVGDAYHQTQRLIRYATV